MSSCSPHNLTKRGSVLVLPPGIEPGSSVLQTGAMTTSAKVAYLVLLERIELSLPPYQRGVLPFNYKSMVPAEGIEPSQER
jgi:hypothetical protein